MSEIQFSLFGDLIEVLRRHTTVKCNKAKQTPNEVFSIWLKKIGHPNYPPGTGKYIFNMLFCKEHSKLRYNIGGRTLAKKLADKVICVSTKPKAAGERLACWSPSLGVLGDIITEIYQDRCDIDESKISIAEVYRLLEKLSASSTYSQSQSIDDIENYDDDDEDDLQEAINRKERDHTPSQEFELTLKELYSQLSARDAGYVTQILIRDLRPILYPPFGKGSSVLITHTRANRKMLNFEECMNDFHPLMCRIYRTCANINLACEEIEKISPEVNKTFRLTEELRGKIESCRLFYPVAIPAFMKGVCFKQTTKNFFGEYFAERKYDGQRAQIHVEAKPDKRPHIKIFSKSGRESTKDLSQLHPVILASLGIMFDHLLKGLDINDPYYKYLRARYDKAKHTRSEPTFNAIIEGEIVPYNETQQCIDHFYHMNYLRRLANSKNYNKTTTLSSQSSNESVETVDDEVNEHNDERHLMFVAFDIIYHNEECLRYEYLKDRRQILENVVTEIEGFSKHSEYISLDFDKNDVIKDLNSYFAKIVSQGNEGIVLKPARVYYNDDKYPSVKFKKDYIAGLGDGLDFAIVGGTWNSDRALDLGVDGSVITTWYAAVLDENTKDLERKKYKILFTVSFGLNRKELEELNCNFFDQKITYKQWCKGKPKLDYDIEVNPGSHMNTPDYFLTYPPVFEIYGDRFTKSSIDSPYVIRFPRVSKWHKDRLPQEVMTSEDLERIAENAVEQKDEDELAAAEKIMKSRLDKLFLSPLQQTQVQKRPTLTSSKLFKRKASLTDSMKVIKAPRLEAKAIQKTSFV